jgi:acyl-CoA thioesterase-1
VILALFAAPGCGWWPDSGEAIQSPRRIVVLGDSLTVSPSFDESFVARLDSMLGSKRSRWTLMNAGVRGDTTSGGVQRVQGLLADDVGVLVVALGANDGLRGVTLSIVEQNLSTIIEKAQRRHIRVLLCGMETPPTKGWSYTMGFRRIFPRLAKKYSVPLVPFLLAGVALDPNLNGADGIHPNEAGARQIADTLWPYLKPLLR